MHDIGQQSKADNKDLNAASTLDQDCGYMMVRGHRNYFKCVINITLEFIRNACIGYPSFV